MAIDWGLYQGEYSRLQNRKRVVKHGQTYVLVKHSEQHLPRIPLGAYQKAKYLTLVDQSFALIEDI